MAWRRRRTDVVDAHPVRDGFGGTDIPATLAGLMAALGTAVLIGGLLTAAGAAGAANDAGTDTQLQIGAAVAGLVTLLIAFFVGGWTAGRIARYDGGRNGFLTALWFVILAAALAGLAAWAGDRYDILNNVSLPGWAADSLDTTRGIVYGVVALIVMFGAAILGGLVGTRYHRRADDTLVAAIAGRDAYPRDNVVVTDDTQDRVVDDEPAAERLRGRHAAH